MQTGPALPQFGLLTGASRIAPFAAEAERLGFGSLWVGERRPTGS